MEVLAVPTMALSREAIENRGWTHSPWHPAALASTPCSSTRHHYHWESYLLGVTWNTFIIQPSHKLLWGGSEILSGNVLCWSLPSSFWGRVSCNWVFLSLTKQRMILSLWLPCSFFPSVLPSQVMLCRGLNQGLKHSTSWVHLWSHCLRSLLSPCLCVITSLCSAED